MCTYIVFVHEHVKLSNADPQISLIELVWNIPTQGTKCSPFLNNGVEKAQAIQHLLEFSLQESKNS